MKSKSEERIPILVALLVLFSAMLEPLATAVFSLLSLVALGIYKFVSNESNSLWP